MKQKTKEASGAPQVTAFHNPGPKWTLGLPGEKKGNAMAKTKKANAAKKKSSSKKNKKTSAAASSSSKSKKANPAKKRRRKQSRGKRNPLELKGVDFMQLGVAGLVAIGSQAVTSVFFNPASPLGIGMGIALTFAVAAATPRAYKTGATIGAGVVPIVNGINLLTKNAIGDTITTALRKVIPAGLLGSGASVPPQTQTGMAGPRRSSNGMSGVAEARYSRMNHPSRYARPYQSQGTPQRGW